MRKISNILLILASLIAYLSPLIPPDRFWPAGFMAYGIPAILILNLLVFIWRVKDLKWSALYPLFLFLIGWGFVKDTVQMSGTGDPGTVDVVSFNTRVFNVYNNNGRDTVSVREIINWIRNKDADILCFQEFYNHDDSRSFNTIEQISNEGYSFFFIPVVRNPIGAEFGTIIFSKYPVIDQGLIDFGPDTNNNVIYADIKIGMDTIRVYNMHLHSLHIDDAEVINAEDIQAGFEDLAIRLKDGFINRAQQIRKLKQHLQATHLPVILCGDLNDLPYSYAYQQLNNSLKNGFSQAGNGFGFTFNGNLFFLRIDHLFYSDQLKIKNFTTHREMKISDHFPLSGSLDLQ